MICRPLAMLAAVCSLPIWVQQAFSQETLISIESNISGAKVSIDSVEVGIVPLRSYVATPGKHRICVISPDVDPNSWWQSTACEDVILEPGSTGTLVLDIPRLIQVSSEPFGAQVVLSDSLLGETPLVLSTRIQIGSVVVRKNGFESVSFVFDTTTHLLHARLRSERYAEHNLHLGDERVNSTVPIAVAAASAVLSGTAAAFCKLRADNLYHDYRASGDASRLGEIRRLDLTAGVALGVSQLSLAMLVYLLMSE